MNIGFALIANSLLLGVGLAMDAFSVSLANGLAEPHMRRPKMALIAGVFGVFQGLMPMVGWVFIHYLVKAFEAFEKFIPWIALILLLFIGGKMLMESIINIKKHRAGEEVDVAGVTVGALIVQGIATSIDALSVGFTIAGYGWIEAISCSLIIAVVTFIICIMGIVIGRKAGTRMSNKAGIFGGIILILIGIEIFITGI